MAVIRHAKDAAPPVVAVAPGKLNPIPISSDTLGYLRLWIPETLQSTQEAASVGLTPFTSASPRGQMQLLFLPKLLATLTVLFC